VCCIKPSSFDRSQLAAILTKSKDVKSRLRVPPNPLMPLFSTPRDATTPSSSSRSRPRVSVDIPNTNTVPSDSLDSEELSDADDDFEAAFAVGLPSPHLKATHSLDHTGHIDPKAEERRLSQFDVAPAALSPQVSFLRQLYLPFCS
jgi:hypothetical protein